MTTSNTFTVTITTYLVPPTHRLVKSNSPNNHHGTYFTGSEITLLVQGHTAGKLWNGVLNSDLSPFRAVIFLLHHTACLKRSDNSKWEKSLTKYSLD